MLDRANRIARADDFKRVVRRGSRRSTEHTLVYVAGAMAESTRFGFIVSKSVGNAVVRNRITRRLRAIGHDYLLTSPPVKDIVVRALPGSAEASWVSLRAEVIDALRIASSASRARPTTAAAAEEQVRTVIER